jgi:hypothetical protein
MDPSAAFTAAKAADFDERQFAEETIAAARNAAEMALEKACDEFLSAHPTLVPALAKRFDELLPYGENVGDEKDEAWVVLRAGIPARSL